MDRLIAIVGGTGLSQPDALNIKEVVTVETPYGDPSNYIALGEINGRQVIFQARHGNPHHVPPHLVNYRANIWALNQLHATQVIAINAVGGIDPGYELADLVINDQILDYSYGREQTFFEDEVHHIDFTYPYDETLRLELISAAKRLDERQGFRFAGRGCYGCTQGPRLESAAEIRRMAQDGCDVVGMTGMPEAALARELAMPYASVSMVVNKAAGIDGDQIDIKSIAEAIDTSVKNVLDLIRELLQPH